MDDLVLKFEKQLVDDINKSGLPMQVIRLVLMEVQNSVIAECNKPVEKQSKEGEN